MKKKFYSLLPHIALIALSLILLAGAPVASTGYVQRRLSGADIVSSATVSLERPSGAYVVFINPALHKNKENLAIWESFFRGEDIGFLFEDISCAVGNSDPIGLEMARSFQSRLPENQMTIRIEDTTLMLSKALYGKFDIIVMSRDSFNAFKADAAMDRDEVIILEEDGI